MYVNVHCMNVGYTDTTYRRILQEADVVYCDGTGVKLAARLTGRQIPQRMTGADWIDGLAEQCARHKLAIFYLGGADGAAADTAASLQKHHPGLRVAGCLDGYSLGHETIAAVNRTQPDILLVGMGSPRQEKWIHQNRDALDVPVVWAVGALFDFVSGRIPRGPRWMTEHGLEWLCRLWAEPRKLWKRYLFGNPVFFWRVARCKVMSSRNGPRRESC